MAAPVMRLCNSALAPAFVGHAPALGQPSAAAKRDIATKPPNGIQDVDPCRRLLGGIDIAAKEMPAHLAFRHKSRAAGKLVVQIVSRRRGANASASPSVLAPRPSRTPMPSLTRPAATPPIAALPAAFSAAHPPTAAVSAAPGDELEITPDRLARYREQGGQICHLDRGLRREPGQDLPMSARCQHPPGAIRRTRRRQCDVFRQIAHTRSSNPPRCCTCGVGTVEQLRRVSCSSSRLALPVACVAARLLRGSAQRQLRPLRGRAPVAILPDILMTFLK